MRSWGWLADVSLALILGFSSGFLLAGHLDDEEPPREKAVRVVEDVPFTLHYADPVIPGDLRIERGWVCDVDTYTAHAYCSEGDE